MNDDEFLSTAEKAIQFLGNLNSWEYWTSKLPSPEDRKIAEICDLYVAATPTQREIFYSSLTDRMCWVFSAFSSRMAMLSVREESEAMLLRGLIALVIVLDFPWTDPRDAAYYDLALMYRSACKLSADPDRLFHTAAQRAVRQLTKDIIDHPKADAVEKLLEEAGWEEVNGPNGLIYRRKGEPIPKGHL